MLSVNDLSMQFGSSVLFSRVDLQFTAGNCYGIIGANGAGKSTFIKILSGELEPTSGSVVLDPKRRMSVLKQNQSLFDDYTVLDTVIIGNQRLYDCGKEKDAIYEKEDFTDEDGIRAAELRQRLFRAVEPERADALLALFVREGKLRFAAERYALADFTVRYTRRQTALRAELLALYRAADLRPERTDRVLARFDAKDRAEAERVLESLLTGGELIALAPRLCLHREVYVCACALVRAYFADHEALTLAAFRDLLGTSRDSALLVLECLDRNDRTRREGDLRRPGRRLYE